MHVSELDYSGPVTCITISKNAAVIIVRVVMLNKLPLKMHVPMTMPECNLILDQHFRL